MIILKWMSCKSIAKNSIPSSSWIVCDRDRDTVYMLFYYSYGLRFMTCKGHIVQFTKKQIVGENV